MGKGVRRKRRKIRRTGSKGNKNKTGNKEKMTTQKGKEVRTLV
jgi:hypothetical protein